MQLIKLSDFKLYKNKKLSTIDKQHIYISFINELQLPKRITTKNGCYQINSFSEKACKKFYNIVFKYNYELDLLFLATKIYYNNITTYKKTLTNYFYEGVYISEYNDLLDKKQNGTLVDYIKEELGENEYYHFKEFNFN